MTLLPGAERAAEGGGYRDPVRITVVSDVHGNVPALAEVAASAEQLVVLGDLLDYVDYHHPERGILGAVFGAERVRHFAELRFAGDFARLHRYNTALWQELADPVGVLTEVVEQRYREVLEAVGPGALLTLGNVDVAAVWNDVAGRSLPYLDRAVVTLDGRRLGFVAGGASRRTSRLIDESGVWHPLVKSADEYRADVQALGPVDVLCSHVPPDLPLLRYDVIPGRLEMAGPGLLEYIDAHRPALAVSGHVHQPLAPRTRRGRTECVNVGHFQRTEQPFTFDLDRIAQRRPQPWRHP
jgi:Icc-related predicted phosphoesterase